MTSQPDLPHDVELTKMLHLSMPFTATVGIVGMEATPQRVVTALQWTEGLTTTASLMHGGALMALADATGAVCAYLNLPESATGTTTIESKTNLMGAVASGDTVSATATPLHLGSTSIAVETELHVLDRLVAKTSQTQLALRPRS